tara:strand:- start:2070 stop:2909 length:840 start_codon:yes stop_codon:yes gene_type:complete
MKKKIIIVGKKSFLAINLFSYLNRRSEIRHVSFKEFIKIKDLDEIDYVINCSSTFEYVNLKYNHKYDCDYQISKKIYKYKKCKLVFLSSRKIYKPDNNIKENGKISPTENYSKNKYITEKKILNILKNRALVLRISNVIGLNENKRKRKLHKTFIDFFIKNTKKNIIFNNTNVYKDFLPINIFVRIVFLLIKKNKFGIFNVSMGKKVFLNDLVGWLNHYNTSKIIVMDVPKLNSRQFNKDIFYLNNNKLIKTIKIKFDLNDLKKECLRISKKLFYGKKK